MPTHAMAHDAPASPWVRAFNWLCLGVAVVALAWLIRSVGVARMQSLMNDTGLWFLVVLASGLAMLALDTLALRQLLGRDAGAVGFARTAATMLAGQAINAVTPTGKLGEATKVVLLSRWSPRRAVLAAVVKTNVISFMINVVVVAIGVPLSGVLFDLPPRLQHVLWAVAGGAGATAILLVWLLHRGLLVSFVSAARRLRIVSDQRRERWHKALAPLDARLQLTSPGATRDAVRGGLLLLASRMLSWLEAGVLLAVLWHFDWRVWLVMISAGMVIGWVGGIVPLGIGVNEGGAFMVFELLGAPPAVGLGIVLIGRVRQAVMAAAGLVLMLWLQASQAAARAAHSGTPLQPEHEPELLVV